MSAKLSWFKQTQYRRSVLRLTTISLSRSLLYFPYIIYLCGLGNFVLWLVLISGLSRLKVSSLVDASIEEGSENLQKLMKRSFSKTLFSIMTLCILIANVTDYMFLVLQIRGIIGIYCNLTGVPVVILIIVIVLSSHLFLKLELGLRQKIRYYTSLSMIAGIILMICAECMYADFRIQKPQTKDFIRFERGRNLQGIVLLMGSFIWNKDILDIYSNSTSQEIDNAIIPGIKKDAFWKNRINLLDQSSDFLNVDLDSSRNLVEPVVINE